VPFIHSPWPFVGVLVGGTLMGTVSGPAQTSVVQQLYPAPERGRALGTVRTIAGVFGIGLAAVAGQLLGWLSFRWVFPAAGVLGMAASLRARRLPVREVPAEAACDRPGLADAWRTIVEDRRYRRLLISSFVFGAGVWIQMPAAPILLADVLQVTTAQVGMLAAFAAAASIAGNLAWGRLVDRHASLRALRAVYTVGALTPLIYFFSRTPWMLIAASVSESLMATGLDLVWMLAVIEFAPPRRTAQYAAIAATLAGVRGVISPLVGAAMIQSFGVHSVYLVATALMAAGAWLVHRQLCARDRPRRIEAPRHTARGLSVVSAWRNAW
jgi:MFS family permease